MRILYLLLFIVFSVPCFSINIDEAISRSANYVIEVSPNGTTLAVINIKSDSIDLSNYILNELPNYLINNKKNLVIVDRSKLDDLQKEINFQLSGEVPDNQIVLIGRRIGAQLVITGTITNFDQSLVLNIKIINIQSAQIVGSRSYEFTKDNKVNSLIRGSQININTPTERRRIQSEQSRIEGNFVKNLYLGYDFSLNAPFGILLSYNTDSIGFYMDYHYGWFNSKGYNGVSYGTTYASDFTLNKPNASYVYDYQGQTNYESYDLSAGITYPLFVPYIWTILGVGWRGEQHYRLYRETSKYNDYHDEMLWIPQNGDNIYLILSAGFYFKYKHLGLTAKYQYILGSESPHTFNIGIGYAWNFDRK